MVNQMNSKMLLKRRFCKRVMLLTITFGVSFYISLLLFGKGTQVMRLSDLYKCPACYGVSVCPELYSNKISLDTYHWTSVFNIKNIYYGYTTSNRRVILKKLASDQELKEFDRKMCNTWGIKSSCKPVDLLKMSNISEMILNIVQYNFTWPEPEPRHGLIVCPYSYSIYDVINPMITNKETNFKSEMLNIWTMLSINPEPIILQMIPKSKGWPVPAYGGVCGRLEVVAHEGEPISALMHVKWQKKLKYAQKILNAAMDFTFKHERFRFYLMDWSLDNIVANDNDEITFVDLEDIIVLDKHISPKKDLPDWYRRYNREVLGTGFTFSIENICKSHLSDHNLWAACYILADGDSPLLYPLPKQIYQLRPHLDRLFKICLNGNNRFQTIPKLQHVIAEILADKIFDYDTLR